jgi:hypothetical protein
MKSYFKLTNQQCFSFYSFVIDMLASTTISTHRKGWLKEILAGWVLPCPNQQQIFEAWTQADPSKLFLQLQPELGTKNFDAMKWPVLKNLIELILSWHQKLLHFIISV